MVGKFPKRPSTDKTAEIGVNLVSTVFNDYFGWVFRRTHQEHDYGIDAYVDYVSEEGSVTGKSLAVQIKTGQSYLTKTGTMHWYKDTEQHLNYFLNSPIPVLLVVCDPVTKNCYWSFLEKDEVDYTGGTWRHPVPKSNKLILSSKNEIQEKISTDSDFANEYKEDLELFGNLEDGSFIQYAVPKVDIISGNIKNIKKFLKRITRNEKLTRTTQGRLYICTYGYESDKREVYQIKQVRKWAKKARSKIDDWYLCAGAKDAPSTLKWLAASTCEINPEKFTKPDGSIGFKIHGRPKEISEFLSECFHGLNIATEKWGWSTTVNYEISKKIHSEFFPDIPFPELDRPT